MSPLRTLLIDDEPPARDILRRLLAAHAPAIEIVSEARSVADAAEKCARLQPHLLFLDVQMPREDGFALLPRLAPPLPAVIFVTAFDAFAVRAFDVNAVDYLLKPVLPDRLARALQRLPSHGSALSTLNPQLSTPPQLSTLPPPPPPARLQPTDTIFLRSDTALRTAPVTAITHIEAEENYTRVHLDDAPPVLLRRTMAEWEALLPSPHFVRIERSLLVNRTAVRQLEIHSRDVAHAHLAGRATPLVLARRASLRLRQALEK